MNDKQDQTPPEDTNQEAPTTEPSPKKDVAETVKPQNAPKNQEPVSSFDGLNESDSDYRSAKFAPLKKGALGASAGNLDLLLDVTVHVSAEMGTKSLPLERVLELKSGSVIELDRPADEPIDLLVNGKPIARGEVVVVDDHFGVRITEILNRESVRQAVS